MSDDSDIFGYMGLALRAIALAKEAFLVLTLTRASGNDINARYLAPGLSSVL